MEDSRKNEDSLVEDCKGYELEYAAIRDEVLNMFSTRDHLEATMYTVCIAIIGLRIVLSTDLVVTLLFMVIIPFQTFINDKFYFLARCGAYINVFIEPNIKHLQWEKIVHEADAKFNKIYGVSFGNSSMLNFLGQRKTSIFAIFACGMYIFEHIEIESMKVYMDKKNIFVLCIYSLLMILVFYLNKKGTDFDKIYETYQNIFQEIYSELNKK